VTERTVSAHGVRFHVREQGSGDPILLLHGFPQTGACWTQVAAKLAERHRVIVPDLPGFGASSPPRSYDAVSVANVLGGLMDEVGAPAATVVGHDWGGSLSFALALTHPERVSNLVVTNAPFRTLDLKRGIHFLAFNLPVLPELAFRAGGERLVAFMLRGGAARKDVFDDATIRPYAQAFADPKVVRSSLGYYRTMTRRLIVRRVSGLRPRRGRPAPRAPRRIQMPTLIVWGMRDPVLTERVLSGIERDIPHARIVRLEGSGHFVPEEAPEELAVAIEEFLANG
jgi:pimeloyl-ACP methyl ester carboxylesterase